MKKKILYLCLIFFIILFSVNANATNNWVVGGAGTRAGADADNGGGFVVDGTADWDDFQDPNGGPSSGSSAWSGSKNGCTVSGPVANVRLTASLYPFTDVVVGSIANVVFYDASDDDITGRYEVTDVDGSGEWVEVDLAITSVDSSSYADCKVGGALDTVANGCTAAASGDSVLVASDDYETAAIDISVNTTIVGVDADGDELALGSSSKPVIKPAASGQSYLLGSGSDISTTLRGIEINCEHASTNATYGLRTVTSSQSVRTTIYTYNCEIANAVSHGLYGYARLAGSLTFTDIHDCGGNGLYLEYYTGSLMVYRCKIYDNTSHGIWDDLRSFSVYDTEITGNGGYGLYADHQAGGIISGCTFADNTSGDINVDSYFTDTSSKTLINTILASTASITLVGSREIVAYNCCITGTTSAATETFDCITDDPLFVDDTSSDYRLETDSPCVDYDTGEVIGALGPEEGSGGGSGTVGQANKRGNKQ